MLNGFIFALFLSLLIGTAMISLIAGYQVGKEEHKIKCSSGPDTCAVARVR